MKNARPGVSRAFCIWYKAFGPLLICRMTRCFLVDLIRGVNQKLCRSVVWVLGIFENLSWIFNQDHWLLLILQRVLLHPNQNRRAAPQWCSHPWSSTCCYSGHSQPGPGWHWDRGPSNCPFWNSVSLPKHALLGVSEATDLVWDQMTGNNCCFIPMLQIIF